MSSRARTPSTSSDSKAKKWLKRGKSATAQSAGEASDTNSNAATPGTPLLPNRDVEAGRLKNKPNRPNLQRNAVMPPFSFWTLGCIYGATSVALGAFGAHGLKRRITDPQKIANWGTAAHYQMLHSGMLLLTASVAPKNTIAASLFAAGMLGFSGSIYLLVLDPQRFKWLGPVTPLGGLCLIGGWVALAFGKRIPLRM